MEESLIFFINGALFTFFLITGIHTFFCARHTGSRPHYLFAVCLAWMMLIEFKEYLLSFMPSFHYEVVGAGFTIPDLFTLPLLSLFFFELVMPGRVNMRYSLKMLSPFIVMTAVYCVGLFVEPYKAYVTLGALFDDLPNILPSVLVGYILYTVVYGVWAVIRIINYSYRYTKEIEGTYSFTEGINLTWIRWMSPVLVLYFVVYFIMICFTPTFALNVIIHMMTLIVWTWLYISIFKYRIPEIIRNYWEEKEEPVSNASAAVSASDLRFEGLAEKVDEALKKKQMYLDPTLTIVSLATECCTNRTSLSQYFNIVKEQSFRDYINHCRVEHSIELMVGGKHKISELAELSGFGSTVTYYRAFTKEKGMTPQQWQAKHTA